MSKRWRAKQYWLLAFVNPLNKRLGADFFKQLPKTPGVYWMIGKDKQILYVGKAKNLQNRIRSYRQVKPGNASRKVLRMVNRVREIRWEECASEEKAYLRENELLRFHQPPFNIVNTHPETYYFLGFRMTKCHVDLCITTQPQLPDLQLYGTYKGRGIIRNGYSALLRLLWAVLSEDDELSRQFKYPGVLTRKTIPPSYTFKINEKIEASFRQKWERHIQRFLTGCSRSLLVQLTETLLAQEKIPPFMYHFIQQDLETLGSFYQYGPRRTYRLRRFHRLETVLIAQEQIDDLLVTYRMRMEARTETST